MADVPHVVRSTRQTFCILYWKANDPMGEKRVLRRINSNGTPVSTKKYSEVFFYNDVRHAMPHAKFLLDSGWNVDVKKCNYNKNDKFWLA
jgi:hypothetical protein